MLMAVTAEKGAPGVTTACVALAAVWPRPVLLAECDPAGGDLAGLLPAAGGARLDPGRGLLSLAAAARHGVRPDQVWAHTQKLHGGLDVLLGVVTPEQGAGLDPLWGPLGEAFAGLPGADVIADCGRIGPDGPRCDLLAASSAVLLVTRATLPDVVRLRERIPALAAALARRGRPDVPLAVVVAAGRRRFHAEIAETRQSLLGAPAQVIGGLARESRAPELTRGPWDPRLGRSLLIRTARELAGRLLDRLDPAAAGRAPAPGAAGRPAHGPGGRPGAGTGAR